MRRLLLWAPLSLVVAACGGGGGSSGGGGGNPAPGTTLHFSTYLGSNAHDFVRDVAVDSQGNVFAAGGTNSTDLPTTPGTAQPGFAGVEDAFVVKFHPDGRILWSTYLGGTSLDRAYAVELNPQGDVVLAGRAGAGFPVTPGALQTQFQGGTPSAAFPAQDGFVATLDGATGALVWATYFGASVDQHIIRDVAIDPATGFIYLAASSDPGTFTAAVTAAFANGYHPARFGGEDGVLAKLSPSGSQMPWATFVGGTAEEEGTTSVRVDSGGNPVILFRTLSTNAETTAGAFGRTPGGLADFYVAKFAVDGRLIWATYLGGTSGEGTETHNLAIRSDGTIVVAGGTTSMDFPTTPGAFDRTFNGGTDCAIAILDGAGSTLLSSTYYGGASDERCEGVGADSNGNVYVTGGTSSTGMPTTIGAFQTSLPGGRSPFLAVLARDLAALRYGTFYGGSGFSIGRALAVHGEGHFAIGAEAGVGFPLKNAVRGVVSSGTTHGGVADLTVTLGPG